MKRQNMPLDAPDPVTFAAASAWKRSLETFPRHVVGFNINDAIACGQHFGVL
jgi:hypothetical protein